MQELDRLAQIKSEQILKKQQDLDERLRLRKEAQTMKRLDEQ